MAMTLAQARESIGARVLYVAPFESRDEEPEYGTIVGVQAGRVLVSFGEDGLDQWISAQRLTVTP